MTATAISATEGRENRNIIILCDARCDETTKSWNILEIGKDRTGAIINIISIIIIIIVIQSAAKK
jgi:hypothetical protein